MHPSNDCSIVEYNTMSVKSLIDTLAKWTTDKLARIKAWIEQG